MKPRRLVEHRAGSSPSSEKVPAPGQLSSRPDSEVPFRNDLRELSQQTCSEKPRRIFRRCQSLRGVQQQRGSRTAIALALCSPSALNLVCEGGQQ